MAGFVQIIEMQTSRIDEVMALTDELRSRASEGATVRRGTYTRDRDRAGYYMAILEFDSYAQRYDSSGERVGSEFRINDTTEGTQIAVGLATLADGGFAAAWNGNGPGDSDGIFGKTYDWLFI